jgi:CRISPR-associated endonuclease/helicase Cas3
MDITDLRYDKTKSTFKIGNDEILMWAHPNEPLQEHVNKTKVLFEKFIDQNIIKRFYEHFQTQGYLNISYSMFQDVLYKMVDFHDAAKISFNFQLKRLKNLQMVETLKKQDLEEYIDLVEIKHSYVSSLLYFSFLIDNLNLKDNIITLILAYAIYGHHTSIRDILNQEEFVWSSDESEEETFYLFSKYYFDKDIDNINLKVYQNFQEDLYNFLKNSQDPAIPFFYSYIYSLLVTSDVISSSYANKNIAAVKEYSKNWNNRINESMQNSMEENFYKKSYNKESKILSDLDLLSNEEIELLDDINDLRTEMLKEASVNLTESLKKDPTKKIFYLNMPTGGGKTNTSMKLALDILQNTDINRIIYAMPFINIIEQNYDVIKGNFGLNETNGEIRAIYSASESLFSDASNDDKSEIIMKDSFFDYPVICTTFVSLFNSLIKNKKKYKYSLASLTNSVVILDEIQSLPLKNWTSLYYLINELAENYNIYFIIMSATLPQFDNLKLNKTLKFNYGNVHLIKNPLNYFSHRLFDRTQINGDVTELEIDTDDNSNILDFLEEILTENFENGYNHGLMVLNTIKVSRWVYECLIELEEEYDFEIDLLNSTILPSEKRKIIYKINNMNENSRYILVSTQSVEAGVDVSFDFVLRDFSTLDSIEQVQGRCNRSRELNKRFKDDDLKGNAYLVNLKRKNRYDHELIYDKEELETKIRETRFLIENNPNYNYENVLKYYESVSNDINQIQDEKEENFVFMDRNNIESWNKLRYSEINDNQGIHIIQNKGNQCSFFVSNPLNIFVEDKFPQNLTMIEFLKPEELNEIYENNGKRFIFTSNELNYLKKYESECGVRIIKGNILDGSDLIECFSKQIEKFKKDFGSKKIIQKEFSSILHKFIFQVSGNDLENLIKTQDLDKRGYFHVIPEKKIGEGEDKIYSIKTGFNFDFMKKYEEDENFIF